MSLIGQKLGTRPAADKPRAMRQSRRRGEREQLKGTSSSRAIGRAVRYRDTLGNEYSVQSAGATAWRLLARPQRPLRERRRYMRSLQAASQLRRRMERALRIRRGDQLRLLDIASQTVFVATVVAQARSPITGLGVTVVTPPVEVGDVVDPESFAAQMLA